MAIKIPGNFMSHRWSLWRE